MIPNKMLLATFDNPSNSKNHKDLAARTGTRAASISRRAHSSTLPTELQRRSLPLHSAAVSALDLDEIIHCMHPQAAARFRDTLSAVYYPPEAGRTSYAPPSSFLRAHADQLVEHRIVEVVDEAVHGPTLGAGMPFTVVESKSRPDGSVEERLRFIFWPKLHNDALVDYEARVDLKHVSAYVPGVHDQSAFVGDLASGFYQVPIPADARKYHRFRDETGRLLQMTRMEMGIKPAVEVMQTVTLVLIGSPLVCRPECRVRGVRQDAFVDDFRVSGNTAVINKTAEIITLRARALGITLKAPLVPSTKYTFLGADFDLNDDSITMGSKMLAKLPTTVSTSMSAADLERLVCRLIHCAGFLRIPLVKFHFALKWTTRRFNYMNRPPDDPLHLHPRDLVNVPASIHAELAAWLEQARSKRLFNPRPLKPHVTIFTDASLIGFGAILINEHQQIFVLGGKWPSQLRTRDSGDISKLEAFALVFAIEGFKEHIVGCRNIDLRIDNTSVVAAVVRGNARAITICEALKATLTWLAANDIAVTVSYVKSCDNIADPISRAEELKLTCKEAILLYERKGRGGAPWKRAEGG